MPLRRLVILALLAGAIGAFVASLLRPRARPHPIAAAKDSVAVGDSIALGRWAATTDSSEVTG